MTHAATTIVCVGALVTRDDSVLAVRQADGHSLEGQWTIPWGTLEDGESPSAAAIREVREEADIQAKIEGLVGVQELPEPWPGWIAMIFQCRYVDGEPKPDARETDAARFLTLDELHGLAEPFEPWSLWLLDRALRDGVAISRDTPNPYSPSPGFLS